MLNLTLEFDIVLQLKLLSEQCRKTFTQRETEREGSTRFVDRKESIQPDIQY